MKILLTGGKGFIARNLCEQLCTEHQVCAPGSEELDLLDAPKVGNFIKDGGFDVVVHTATYDAAPKASTKDPSKVLEKNLRMFFSVARCSRDFGKMIYFGSGAEFSREHWKPRMAEDYFDANIPCDQYGLSKYIMTKYAQSSANIYNLRLFGVFGKYDDWRYRFIPNVCARAAINLPVIINQCRFFDFLYIDDLARIVSWFIANKPSGKVYNVCTGAPQDFKTLAEKAVRISGKKLKIIVQNPGSGVEYSGDNSALLEELKGFKFTSPDTGIKIVYDWCESRRADISKAAADGQLL
ncbi:MAG TPA: NAD-dependent dehydratase [Elusimicrobia bacterium]|nr:NAD-dependent dehydratase [Elusimicrobiota bacterium]